MNLLKPIFYDEFSCIGAECPLTCCAGWRITIDDDTFKNYRKMGGKIASFAKKNMVYEERWHENKVQLKDNGLCPMLNDKQLCEVVLCKGTKHLSQTCKIYPRETVHSFDTNELYLSLSCPRALELLFALGEKVKFVLEEDEKLNLENIPVLNQELLINLKVREMVGDFIQDADLPLWFREFYSAYTIEKLSSEIKAKNFDGVVSKLSHLYETSFYQAMYDGIKNTSVNREQQFQSLCGTVNAFERSIRGAIFVDKYGYAKKIEELLMVNRQCTFDEWNHSRETWREQVDVLQQENMLVYNWMVFAFNFKQENMLLTNYIMTVLINILTNHLIILHGIKYEPDKQMEKVIAAFVVRTLQHGDDKIMKTVQMGMDENILSPTFLLCLCNL